MHYPFSWPAFFNSREKKFRALVLAFAAIITSSAYAQPSGAAYGFSHLAGPLGGFGNADGIGSAARFDSPSALTVDTAGNVFVVDETGLMIRKISPTGSVTFFSYAEPPKPGTGETRTWFTASPSGLAVDGAGNLYVASIASKTILRITPDGTVSLFAGTDGVAGSTDGMGSAAQFDSPNGLALDSAGNVYVADTGNHTIRRITTAGVVTTFAGSTGVSGNANGTGTAAQFNSPTALAFDNANNLYVADTGNSIIREITPAGVVTTLAGSGSQGSANGTGTAASFYLPIGIAIDGSNNLYVTDSYTNVIRKITTGGVVTTFAGTPGSAGAVDGTGANARFQNPSGIATDITGNLYISDNFNNTIRKRTFTGIVTTLAGLAGGYGSVDGTGTAARFNYPNGIAVTDSGVIYVADSGNETIRKVSPTGAVTILAGKAGESGSADGDNVAARFDFPLGIAVDRNGNAFVADTNNHTIRRISANGTVTTVAGLAGSPGSTDGSGASARFDSPHGVAVDAAGNVFVADTANSTIRQITPSGSVSTLAGLAESLGSVDGTGSAARFNQPQGVAIDSTGNIYVADTENSMIRKITPTGIVSTPARL